VRPVAEQVFHDLLRIAATSSETQGNSGPVGRAPWLRWARLSLHVFSHCGRRWRHLRLAVVVPVVTRLAAELARHPLDALAGIVMPVLVDTSFVSAARALRLMRVRLAHHGVLR